MTAAPIERHEVDPSASWRPRGTEADLKKLLKQLRSVQCVFIEVRRAALKQQLGRTRRQSNASDADARWQFDAQIAALERTLKLPEKEQERLENWVCEIAHIFVHDCEYRAGVNTPVARNELRQILIRLLRQHDQAQAWIKDCPVPASEFAGDALQDAPLVHQVLFTRHSEYRDQLCALIRSTDERRLTVEFNGADASTFPLQWVPDVPEPKAARGVCALFCEYYGPRFAEQVKTSLKAARGKSGELREGLYKFLDLLSAYAIGVPCDPETGEEIDDGKNGALRLAFNAAIGAFVAQRKAAAEAAEDAKWERARAATAKALAVPRRGGRVLICDTGTITVARRKPGSSRQLATPIGSIDHIPAAEIAAYREYAIASGSYPTLDMADGSAPVD